jgi:hypothetical protein
MAVMAFSLAGLFGCSKTTAPKASAAKAPATESKVKDLGVLQLTNHYETCVAIGTDCKCRIVPNLQGRTSLQMTLTVESRGTDGKTSALSVVQLTGQAQKPIEFSVGDSDFSFTPQVAKE